MSSVDAEAYTIEEIADAACVPVDRVMQAVRAHRVSVHGTFVLGRDAVQLVRGLRPRGRQGRRELPLTVMREPVGHRAGPLAISAALHALMLAFLITAASLGLLSAPDTEERVPPVTSTARLVYLMQPGPGGGGGGGGMKMPQPAPKAERKAPAKKKISSPVPPAAKRPVPPRPIPPRPVPPRPTPAPPRPAPVVVPPAPSVPAPVIPVPTPAPPAPPTPAPPAPAPPAVVAPVASVAADANDRIGVPADAPGSSSSYGPGSGGGVGSGAGQGLGEGQGGGIGPGSGGGTGGGPFRPGTGIAPPQLLREVRANYTDDARKRAIEGDVDLEIVIKRDGSVGQVRVLRSLGGGLEQKAIDAVRQWKFSPATRYGSPVDVVVEVSVGFKLR